MSTPRKLWLGFGALTALLVLSVLVIAARLSFLNAQANESAGARARVDVVRELEIHFARYNLAVREGLPNGGNDTLQAEEEAAAVEAAGSQYSAMAQTGAQKALAARFDAAWSGFQQLSDAVQAPPEGSAPPEAKAAFQQARRDLRSLLDGEMRQDALGAFETRRTNTHRNLRDLFGLTLIVLGVGALLAVATSAAVSRGVLRDRSLLAEQGERFRTTLGSIGDAVITTDAQSNVTEMNAVAQSLTGWTIGAARGRPLDDVFRIADEITRKPVVNPAKQALESGKVVGLGNHTVLLGKDGSERPIDDSAAPIRSRSGQIVGCVLVFRDVTARRRSDLALRASEERFRSLVVATSQVVWSTDADGRVVEDSPSWRDFTGQTYDEWKDAGWLDAVHPEDREHTLRAWRQAVERKDFCQVEYRLRQTSGAYRWTAARGVPVLNADGSVREWVGANTDVTERVEADGALRRKTSALETIHRVNLSLAGDLNLDSLIQSVTDAATAITRARFGAFFYNRVDDNGERYMLYSLSGAPRSAFEKFGMPGKTAIFTPTFEGSGVVRSDDITQDPKYGLSAPHHGMPKGHLPVRSYLAVPVVSRSGDVHGGLFFGHPEVGVFDDEDEQVVAGIAAQAAVAIDNARLYEQLRNSEERFRALSETVPAIIWACRPDGRLFYLNAAWTELTGQSIEDSQGLGWASMVHRDDRSRILDHWKRCVASREFYEGEVRYRRRDGSYRWHFFRGTPVRSANGDVTVWHGASIDIQEQKSAEEALREADRRKDEFLATLSHELRNPLAPITMGLEVLKASLHDPAKVEETRAMMSRQTRQLIRLVDDLLDVSRITRGRLELRRSKVKLADVIGSAVEASQVFVDEARNELSVSLPGEPVLLDADPNRLAQIVSNVLINAAKYTPKGGHIRLSAAPEGDHGLILTISDTGIGIPADMLERVFEMFTQVQAADGSPSSGLGIGLTLVQSLVRMHGGAIQAGSAGPNQGSEFRISLPIVIGSADDEAPIPAPRLASRTKRRVLIVDDNQTAAEMLGMVVEMLGNEVRTAHDGRQAIEIAGQFLPEIVFMDLAMPLVDGYEAARQIRKKPWGKSTLLVALTGWGQEEHKKQTKEAGFDHHLVKPGDFADLQRVFAELEGHG